MAAPGRAERPFRPLPGLILLVAMTREGVIGRQGGLPWHLPEELALFRRLTWGHTLIMGRRTHESIGRPLPGRRNLVVSRDSGRGEGVEICGTLQEALERALAEGREFFVIGGLQVYRQALPLAEELAISWIDDDCPGDLFFPPVDWERWQRVEQKRYAGFEHVRYRRRQGQESLV